MIAQRKSIGILRSILQDNAATLIHKKPPLLETEQGVFIEYRVTGLGMGDLAF